MDNPWSSYHNSAWITVAFLKDYQSLHSKFILVSPPRWRGFYGPQLWWAWSLPQTELVPAWFQWLVNLFTFYWPLNETLPFGSFLAETWLEIIWGPAQITGTVKSIHSSRSAQARTRSKRTTSWPMAIMNHGKVIIAVKAKFHRTSQKTFLLPTGQQAGISVRITQLEDSNASKRQRAMRPLRRSTHVEANKT